MTTAREIAFYTSAGQHRMFQKWMLTFFGTLELSGPELTAGPTTHGNTSIVLQNLTYGFEEACVMDIKLGAQLCDDEAPPEKRDRLEAISNAMTSHSLGIHIAGMKVWKGKAAGGWVTEVRGVLHRQESRMYSASLLSAFGGHGKALETALKQEEEKAKRPPNDEDDDSEDEKVKKVEVLKLIDFAHTNWTPGKGPDENALQGFSSTERLLAELIK